MTFICLFPLKTKDLQQEAEAAVCGVTEYLGQTCPGKISEGECIVLNGAIEIFFSDKQRHNRSAHAVEIYVFAASLWWSFLSSMSMQLPERAVCYLPRNFGTP